jgi:DNA repair protein RadC
MKNYKTKIPEFKLKKEKSDFQNIKITCPKDGADFIRNFYSDDIAILESFFLLLLNRANNTIGYAKISQGGTAGTVVDIKLVAKYAVDSLASGVILAHNHPSGNLRPSSQDKDITQRIKVGLEFLDIKVIDHVILIEGDKYFSFSDHGLL